MLTNKQIFDALPHVKTIWRTKDGNFHLHPHMGGQEVSREDVEKERPAKAAEKAEPEVADVIEAADKKKATFSTGE
jgi:hypothetical protein